MRASGPSDSRVWRHAGALHVPHLQYCYEGVGMILPIESSMKERERFGPVLQPKTPAFVSLSFLAGLHKHACSGGSIQEYGQ